MYASYNYIDGHRLITEPMTQILALNLELKTAKFFKVLRIYGGAHVGAINTEINKISTNERVDDTDRTGGFQAGTLIELGNHIALEAGYKYSWTTSSNESLNGATVQTYYGALNLKF